MYNELSFAPYIKWNLFESNIQAFKLFFIMIFLQKVIHILLKGNKTVNILNPDQIVGNGSNRVTGCPNRDEFQQEAKRNDLTV